MTDIERLRHSAAQVLATAILRISPEDFAHIEEEMKKEIKANNVFERTVVSRDEAVKLAESRRLGGLGERPGNPSKFKIGNLADMSEDEEISLFRKSDFHDL